LNGNVKETKTAVLMAVFFSVIFIFPGRAESQSLSGLDREIAAIVDNIAGSVVTVEARPREARAPVFPGRTQSISRPVNAVVGSGLLIDSSGHILTSLGLVDGYDDFRVALNNRVYEARSLGVDHRYNLAVLKIDSLAVAPVKISAIPPAAGRIVVAYGNALGNTGYPALGIIAGRQNDGSYLISGTVLPGLLGGGIFDLNGRLIGVISSGSVVVNDIKGTWGGIVMLPVSLALSAADRIICCGNHDAGYLGLTTSAIELVSPTRQVLGEAVVVCEVDDGSPAASAGLRVGDIITRVSMRQVTSDRELQRLVAGAGPDSTVILEFIRDRQRMKVPVVLSSSSDAGGIIRTRSVDHVDQRNMMAVELQKRIDSMQAEMRRLQRQLDRLMGQAGTAR